MSLIPLVLRGRVGLNISFSLAETVVFRSRCTSVSTMTAAIVPMGTVLLENWDKTRNILQVILQKKLFNFTSLGISK